MPTIAKIKHANQSYFLNISNGFLTLCAIAEKAAIEHQIAEDEAESLEHQTAEKQLEILESEIDHERDPGEPPRDENAYESMDID